MNTTKNSHSRNPWYWIPTLYLFEGIPYSIVMTTSTLIYKTMGISVATLAFWTSLLYLPWTIKPLWSPYVEMISTKRNWIIWTQLILGVAFIAAGASMPLTVFFPVTLAIFALAAFLSASHDIAADGFYMHALDQHQQTFFVGIRSTFYRIATLAAIGLLPLIAGFIQESTGLKPVLLNVSAVPFQQAEVPNPPEPWEAIIAEKPEILLFSGEVQVPIFEKGVSEADSAATYVALSSPPEPGEKIILNLTYKSGSKDLSIAGKNIGRFEFTEENWNQPVKIVFKVHHNLKNPASAVFRLTAGNIAFSWTTALAVMGMLLILLGIYHRWILPRPSELHTNASVSLKVYGEVFISFFRKPGIVPALLFFLLYRLGESQSIKIATPFLVDSRANGGIGLTAAQYGLAYGTAGVLALIAGGILGGISASRFGLKRLFWFMALAMNLPNLGLLYIAYVQPVPGDIMVYGAIVLEQFGYGFGFTAYMLYMLYFVGESKYKTAEYAIGTSLMALGMMLPGMMSGYIQESIGYQHFFIYVMLCTIPGMALIPFLKVDKNFGIRRK